MDNEFQNALNLSRVRAAYTPSLEVLELISKEHW